MGGAWRERRPERETHFLDTQNSLTRVAFLFYGASQGFCGVRKKRSANRLAPAPCFLSRSKDDLRMNEQRRVSRTLTQVETRLYHPAYNLSLIQKQLMRLKKVSFPEQLDRKRDTQRLTHTHNSHLQRTTHTKCSTKKQSIDSFL